jgi:perosamine synthetase
MTPLRIPMTLPLPLGQLLGAGVPPAPAYPFDGARVLFYYLARNAIWHGADSLGLRPGDEVLMPAYHHGVELQSLLAKGMKLRYYRVDRLMQADLADMRRLLTPGTRALYVIHYLGFPQPIQEIRAMADGAGIPLIEDCALSLWSRVPAGPLGSFGDIGIFCLYKSLPVPHGGTLSLNRPDLPMPPEPTRPDRLSTTAYLMNRLLDAGMVSANAVRRGLSEGLRSAARAAKHAAGSTIVEFGT